ncbi:hypothetical protein C3V36_05365 [Lachnospiraceae bacterium oral taxon 500]|nr:hypothetical protein C3V36_05365 [Lachnospiraceae bacterium oral taxon 500]
MFETKDAKNRENTKKYKSNIEEHKSFRLGNQEGMIFFFHFTRNPIGLRWEKMMEYIVEL